MGPKNERFEMRLDEDILRRIDGWRASQDDVPSRAEAIRRLVETGLAGDGTTRLSDGERLLLLAMRDVVRHLKVKDPQTDLDFVSDVILGGHDWALQWRMPGVFHGHRDNPTNVSRVVDVLDMWDAIERGYEQLSKADRQRLANEVPAIGTAGRFWGFDGNSEAEHLGIAQFLIEKMDRFARFSGRKLNSHMPTRQIYDRMLAAFGRMPRHVGTELSYEEIAAIFRAMKEDTR
jgi:uncharacterized protein YfbU (UPF0304 family)